GEIGAAALAVDQDARRTIGRAHLLRVALEQRNRVRAGAGQRGAEPVEKQVFGAGEHRVGNLLVSESGEKFGQGAGVLAHALGSRELDSSIRLKSGSRTYNERIGPVAPV